MKKKILFALVLCLIFPFAVCFTACGKKAATNTTQQQEAHTHTWSNEWSTDATKHWHACSGCDEKKDEANHTADAHGFCEACGRYLGETIQANTAKEFDSLAVGTYYYRFALDDTQEYKKTYTHFTSSDFNFYGKRSGEWQNVTVDATWRTIADTDDHYVYVVVTTSAVVADGNFTILAQCAHNTVDSHGFCTDCGEYLGTTLTAGNEANNVSPRNGKVYLKVSAEAGQIYEIRLGAGPNVSNSNYALYFEDGGNFVQADSHPRYSDPYHYVYINNELGSARDYYVEINYNSTISSVLLSVHTEHNHTDEVDYFYTCSCGHFNGTTIDVEEAIPVNTATNKTIHFRVPVVDGHAYYITTTVSLVYSEFDFTDSDEALQDQDFSLSNNSADPTTITGYTGYLYFTYTTTEDRDGTFTIVLVHNIDALGVCTICEEYTGESFNEGGDEFDGEHHLDIAPNLTAGEIGFYRVYLPIAQGDEIDYTVTETIVDDDVTITIAYYDVNGTLQNGTLGTPINDQNVNVDDPYIYIIVDNTNGSDFLASEKIRFTMSWE